MPRIIVEDHSGLIWRGSNIDILIDGVARARMTRNVKADFAVNAGKHTIQARSTGAVSRPVDFIAADRESFEFACFSEGLVKKSLVVKQVSHQRHQDRFERETSSRFNVPSKRR
jgi:hypothetical protein